MSNIDTATKRPLIIEGGNKHLQIITDCNGLKITVDGWQRYIQVEDKAKEIVLAVNSYESNKKKIELMTEALKYLIKEAKVSLGYCTDKDDKFCVQHAIDLGEQALKESEN